MGRIFDTRILIVGLFVVLALLIRPSANVEITGTIPTAESSLAH